MEYKRLYIIGNGFDIHHGINSKYSQFKDWLENHQEEYNALYFLNNYFRVDSEFWSDFERSLATFNVQDFAESETRANYPDFFSDHFAREMDMSTYQSKQDFIRLIDEIKSAFHDWVCSLNEPMPSRRIQMLKDNAFFINFNYL